MNERTAEEIRFIKTLGSHSLQGQRLEKSDLVNDYLKALPKRVNWGEVDGAIVTAFAQKYYTFLTAPEAEEKLIPKEQFEKEFFALDPREQAPAPTMVQ